MSDKVFENVEGFKGIGEEGFLLGGVQSSRTLLEADKKKAEQMEKELKAQEENEAQEDEEAERKWKAYEKWFLSDEGQASMMPSDSDTCSESSSEENLEQEVAPDPQLKVFGDPLPKIPEKEAVSCSPIRPYKASWVPAEDKEIPNEEGLSFLDDEMVLPPCKRLKF